MNKDTKIIQAAGGLVLNSQGEILMIFRRGFWDLPKGKLEKGETLEQCALREVCEECGLEIDMLQLQRPLCTTVHHYEQDNTAIEKHSHWWAMLYAGQAPLTPQIQEDIERAVWLTPAEALGKLDRAYATISEVFKAYIG
ncbi:MAG: NUDIX hydrolase [Mucinivorans sp.]